ncbi:MAG: ABC transporter substrate-binding protein [Lachnospiraceae bacterium]|nr:ABC transporter substrate-binding protein [Lachnospiraceae bacterium]
MKLKKLMALGMAAVMTLSLTACGGKSDTPSNSSSATDNNASADKSTTGNDASAPDTDTQIQPEGIPTIDQIKVGEDYKDITASIKVLTNRTDIVDTVYAGYAQQFMEIYPNISVEYEAVTDYEEAVTLRLTAGDWGDIMFIPTSVPKNELSTYFLPLGDYNTLDAIYNFVDEKTFEGNVYGIANGGTAGGIAYNKRVWADAGITEMPKTPDEFLEDLQKIKDNTDAVPLYTNFAAGWTMGAWDQYIECAATGDPDFHNNLPHMKDPFTKRDDMTGPYAVYYVLYESVARKLVEDDPASSDWESSKGAINRGEIATMVLGSWAVNQFKEAGDNPDDIGYMPFPITVNGKQYAGSGGNYGYGINKDATDDNKIASMLYVKWLIEESPMFLDEGSIPARKDGEFPSVLEAFDGVELIANSPAPDGEEDLFDDVNNESEVGINNNDYPDCEILEAALYGSRTLDEIMAEWNQKWTSAQESLGVEVNK